MAENHEASEAPNRNDCSESYTDYLRRAVAACEAGDLELGMHLHLAAYEKSVVDPAIPDGMALTGLREAWRLACELKERSMAEYIFEKLEPFLTGEEIAACAQQLQTLALDRLEQYGFSREELEEMAEVISQDFMGEGSVLKVESIAIPGVSLHAAVAEEPRAPEAAVQAQAPTADAAKAQQAAGEAPGQDAEGTAPADAVPEQPRKKGKPFQVGVQSAPADGFNPYDYYAQNSIGKSYYAATTEGSGAHVFTRDTDRAEAGRKAHEEAESRQNEAQAPQPEAPAAAGEGRPSAAPEDAAGTNAPDAASSEAASPQASIDERLEQAAQKAASLVKRMAAPAKASSASPEVADAKPEVLSYRNLVGYDEPISIMRDFGIGLQKDQAFLDFLDVLNERHGLSRPPALDTMLFRAAAVEDANRFVDATIGEIGLPALRMTMEEGFQGVPVLCVTTQGNQRPRMNHAHNRFESPAILVIENLDTWVVPEPPEGVEGMAGVMMANISRGAREALSMIRSAVEDPDVFVLATATQSGDVDPFFYDLLEPLTVVEIDFPNDKERVDIWTEIARDHPSMRLVNRADLMRLSAGLARFDIYMAAREAVEEAYKIGLVRRSYVPVSPHNIFEKLAACQPLDSDAYRLLEDEVVRSFGGELDNLEDLIYGSED